MSAPREADASAAGAAWLPATLSAWALYGWLAARFWWLCDDGFISFRYARHLARGAGLRFNPAEAPPVEGYSNLLWVLWLAPFEAVGVGAPLAACVTSLVCGALLIALVARFVERRLAAGGAAVWGAALLLASSAPMAVWATGGLETMPFALASFALFERLESAGARRARVGLLVALACTALLRSDGPLWAAALIGGALLLGRRDPARTRAAWLALGALLVLLALHAGFRLGYHGDLVPNTARVKGQVGALRLERGLRYAATFLVILPTGVLIPLAALLLRGRPDPGLGLRAAWGVAFGLALSVLVGGDFLPMGRFLVPTLAFQALLLAGPLRALAGSRARAAVPLLVASLMALSAAPAFDLAPAPRRLQRALDFRWSRRQFHSELQQWRRTVEGRAQAEILARALAASTAPGESLVFGMIGVVGYRTELTLHDRFGLVDREVARLPLDSVRASPGHDRGVDPRFFLPRRPDYLEAYITPDSVPLGAGISPEFAGLLAVGQARVESRPLSVEAGFPPGVALRLVRYLPPAR